MVKTDVHLSPIIVLMITKITANMGQYIYIYDDLKNPGNSISTTSIRQLEKKTKMDERTLGRKFKKGNVYCDPFAGFKIMKLPLEKDNRKKNGNTDNFNKEEL